MSVSNASCESDDTLVSGTELAKALKKDHDKSSGESDEEELVIYPEWYQALWTLKLDPDDNEYLQSEVDKLLMSPFWYKMVFHIPKIPKLSEVVEGVPRMISLRRYKARLRNRFAVYDMVAVTEALRNANDQTLQCLFKNRRAQLKWVREWLELSDLVFRRIVDADSPNRGRGVGSDDDTRQIFRKILDEKKVFWTPKELSYSGIDEYKHRSPRHTITKDKNKAIDTWRYPGWLKGKPPPHRLFHDMWNEPEQKTKRKEAKRKLEDAVRKELESAKKEQGPARRKILGDLAEKRELLKDLQMREHQERRECYMRMEATRKEEKGDKREEKRKEKEEREREEEEERKKKKEKDGKKATRKQK